MQYFLQVNSGSFSGDEIQTLLNGNYYRELDGPLQQGVAVQIEHSGNVFFLRQQGDAYLKPEDDVTLYYVNVSVLSKDKDSLVVDEDKYPDVCASFVRSKFSSHY